MPEIPPQPAPGFEPPLGDPSTVQGNVKAPGVPPQAVQAAAEQARAEERARIVADLERAAAGRREYASDLEPSYWGRKELLAEADALDTAAKVAGGDRLTMCGLIPSWRWTDEEAHAEPATTPQTAPQSTQTGRDAVSQVLGSTDDGISLGTLTALRKQYVEAFAFESPAWGPHRPPWLLRDTIEKIADAVLAVRDDALADALRRAEQAEATVARVRAAAQRDLPLARFVAGAQPSEEEHAWAAAMAAVEAALDVPADGEQTDPANPEEGDR